MRLPDEVLALAGRGPAWASYVDRLPRLLDELVGDWSVVPVGAPRWGRASVLLPVVDADGAEAVLKVGVPGLGADHEALVLQHWGGRGAVRLLRADPHRRAVLLERLTQRDLSEEWDLHACEVVAGLWGRLHVPAPPQLPTLADHAGRRLEPLRALPRSAGIPHRMVEQCAAHLADLVVDPASVGVLVHGDLHYGHVLADDAGEWRAVSPHALSGDPHWEPAPMLQHRFEEVAGDLPRAVRARFTTLVDAGGLDEDRARAWTVVRLVLDAFSTVDAARGRALTTHEKDRVTRTLTLVKAVQA